jgi:hypothetical protein
MNIYNNFDNLILTTFKANQLYANNAYDAFIKVTGDPSSYATNIGFSLDPTNIYNNLIGVNRGNSCGTVAIGASRIDIGNVADEINIGACKSDSAGFNYDTNVPTTQPYASNNIVIGNSLSITDIYGAVRFHGKVTGLDIIPPPNAQGTVPQNVTWEYLRFVNIPLN